MQLPEAIYGIWMFNMRQANFDVANQLSRELLAAAGMNSIRISSCKLTTHVDYSLAAW